jgi:hypothetical protein
MLFLDSLAAVNALTGVNIYAASFLIPIIVTLLPEDLGNCYMHSVAGISTHNLESFPVKLLFMIFINLVVFTTSDFSSYIYMVLINSVYLVYTTSSEPGNHCVLHHCLEAVSLYARRQKPFSHSWSTLVWSCWWNNPKHRLHAPKRLDSS